MYACENEANRQHDVLQWLPLWPTAHSQYRDERNAAASRCAAACRMMLCFNALKISIDPWLDTPGVSNHVCMSSADGHDVAMQALTFPPGSTNRLMFIAAFAVSGYASTKGRTSKPFNPLLGETYELVHQQKVCDIAQPSRSWCLHTATGSPGGHVSATVDDKCCYCCRNRSLCPANACLCTQD